MNKPTRKLVGFININFMNTWDSKNFDWFCKHYNITKDNPRYKLLKGAENGRIKIF